MAKKAYSPDPKAETIKRIQRTEAYAEKVRRLFAATVNEILALNKSVPSISKEVIDRLLALYESEMVDDADNRLRQYTERIWATLTKEERIILTKYTQTYSYLNEPLRGISYYGARAREEFEHDLPILTRACLLYTSPSPRDRQKSRMPSSA